MSVTFNRYEFMDLEEGVEWNRVFYADNLKEALEVAKEEMAKNKIGRFAIRRICWNGKIGNWVYFKNNPKEEQENE